MARGGAQLCKCCCVREGLRPYREEHREQQFDGEGIAELVRTPLVDFCEFKETLQSALPFSLCAMDLRCACPEEIPLTGARRYVQRFNNHIRQNAVDRYTSLLRMQK